jgi:hypothetical protein
MLLSFKLQVGYSFSFLKKKKENNNNNKAKREEHALVTFRHLPN